MILFDHQQRAVDVLRDSLKSGNRAPLLAAFTSFGKTVVAANMLKSCQDKGKRGIFIADRIKLVSQTLSTFDKLGIDCGVMQGNHERTDPGAPIQIASVQTLACRKNKPIFDFAIVDECHTMYQYIIKMMRAYDNIPFVGLSATPFSKGLGRYWDDLIVPITPGELLEQGFLCPVKYFAGHHVDLSGVKSRALPTGGSDYDPKQHAAAVEADDLLVGNVIENWFKYSEGFQTICFTPSVKSSKWMVDEFNASGVAAEHIDGYTDPEHRAELYEAHDNGEFKILSCSRLLNTGYDAPKVRCLIDCYKVKSHIAYVQRAGRLMRTSDGKPYAHYHDHADNLNYFKLYPHEIVPGSLDKGDKRFSEKNQIKDKEKKERKKNDCPDCYQEFLGVACECGYEVPKASREQLQNDGSELIEVKLNAAQRRNKSDPKHEKSVFYGEMIKYCVDSGKKLGYAKHKYKERYSVWPNKISPANVDAIRPETLSWVKSQNIRYAKKRNTK